jgi:DNA-binding response OmpR family regulator
VQNPTAQDPLRLQAKVLLISDEPVAAKVWGFSLNQVGLDVTLIGISDDALGILAVEAPDLIIIEDFNEQIEELDICQQLRAAAAVPILFLTNKPSEAFYLEAYRQGADDCISLSISPRLFQAKVTAWLRWTMSMPFSGLEEFKVAGFHLITSQKHLTLPGGKVVRLTNLETRLLSLLISHPGKVFSDLEITEKVWGYFGSGDSRLLKNHIYRLRRKIEPDPSKPRYLVSEGVAGYKLLTEEI